MAENITATQLETYSRLLDLGHLLERQSDRMLREAAGMTMSQYRALIFLRNSGGEMRMAELANLLVATPSGATYQLTQLEKLGYAERVAARGDDRGVVARITQGGRDAVAAVRASQNDLIWDAVVAPLSAAELGMLHELLGRLQLQLRGGTLPDMLPEDAPAARG